MAVVVNSCDILLPTGTRFGISMIEHGSHIKLELVELEKNRIVALFSKDDVDFCIDIDNTSSPRQIQFDLTINKDTHGFSIDSKKGPYSLEALTTLGKKLHFLGQETDLGKILVAQTAAKYGIGVNAARKMCSELRFNVEVGKLPTPIRPFRRSRKHSVRVFVKTLTGSTIPFMVNLEETVLQLKNLIANKEGIPTDDQRLVHSGRQLEDFRLLLECGICPNSVMHLLLRQRGGGGGVLSQSAEEATIKDKSKVGARGVICFGERSDQMFQPAAPFHHDETYQIGPFTIELRMVPKYTPV